MELLRSLGTCERTVDEVLTGLDLVCTLLSNITGAPAEAKFRRVKKKNPRVASVIGREEEGLLRAAGFQDSPCGELLVCPGPEGADERGGAPAEIVEVLEATRVACGTLRRALRDGAEGDQACRDPPQCSAVEVRDALDCALLDHVGQRSKDQAEMEKKRRRVAVAEAVHSPRRWRDALCHIGGEFLVDGGGLEAWLEGDARHRQLAWELLELQASAARWYGAGAKAHCDRWRTQLVKSSPASGDEAEQRLVAELQTLRLAIFEFPEQPGGAPELFRKAEAEALAETPAPEEPGEGDCALVAGTSAARSRPPPCVVALE